VGRPDLDGVTTYRRRQLSATVELAYIDCGTAQDVIVMIPGWAQTAAQFAYQIEDFKRAHRVVAIDMRGHGESSKPTGGYRTNRLAADLHELLVDLDLHDIVLLGHSMGASVVWAYIDLYGAERISRTIWVDQAPVVTGKPGWDEDEIRKYGCTFSSFEVLAQFAERNFAANTVDLMKDLLRPLFSERVPEETLTWVAKQNLKMSRQASNDMLLEHSLNDWRDVLQGVTLPTLVIGGERSIFTAESQRWIASQNKNARVEIIGGDDGGSHFMFMESPELFNEIVLSFVDG
jgi:non-heme chloroperoxidase